jgi:hypothetical protein
MLTRSRLAAVALPLAFVFGCATVRAPASTIDPTTPVRDGVAEPQVELYLESSEEVDPAALAQAGDDARRALREALADRHAPDGDAVLVVRAQAVSRTAARRADQRAAVAGLVVGAVVIAAVVVLVVVSGKGGGGGVPKGSAHVARHAPGAAPAPRAVAAAVHAPRPPPRVPGGARPRAAPIAGAGPARPPFSIDAEVFVQLPPIEDGPLPLGPAEPLAALGPEEAEPPLDGEPLELDGPEEEPTVTVAPPPPLDLADRGYFAGDLLRLELLLVDPRDGQVLASKTVSREVDVRDAHAVRTLVSRALDEPRGWAPRRRAVAPGIGRR